MVVTSKCDFGNARSTTQLIGLTEAKLVVVVPKTASVEDCYSGHASIINRAAVIVGRAAPILIVNLSVINLLRWLLQYLLLVV